MNREDEVMRLVRSARGDEEAFEAALVELAKRDVVEVLAALLLASDSGPPGSVRAASYAELAALGRRLAASAGLVAHHEERSPA
jgi:hypothetical protein